MARVEKANGVFRLILASVMLIAVQNKVAEAHKVISARVSRALQAIVRSRLNNIKEMCSVRIALPDRKPP
jgi:hypothetical protein